MARKPDNHVWSDVTEDQAELLDSIDFYGNNAWDRNGQSEELMPRLMARCAEAGLSVERIQEEMESIGYSRRAIHQLRRWERKRTTGYFGK